MFLILFLSCIGLSFEITPNDAVFLQGDNNNNNDDNVSVRVNDVESSTYSFHVASLSSVNRRNDNST